MSWSDPRAAVHECPLEGSLGLRTQNGTIRIGASSWSDRSLTHESSWYPKRTMKAAERISYYCERFPLVEIDSTARFPPTPDVARQWAERTPPGFTIDIAAWSLLTGAATLPDSLWEDLRGAVRDELRDRRRLYASHLSSAGMEEAWARFRHALLPLHEAGRLGAVLLRYPHWLKPGNTGRAMLQAARRSLPEFALAAELQHHRWLEGDACEETLALLESLDIGFVCADGHPGLDDDNEVAPVLATSSDLAVVRMYGPGGEWGARYEVEELEAWVPKLLRLAESAHDVHVLFANTVRDHAVSNAAELMAALASRLA